MRSWNARALISTSAWRRVRWPSPTSTVTSASAPGGSRSGRAELGGTHRACAAHSAVARSRSAPMPCLRFGSSRYSDAPKRSWRPRCSSASTAISSLGLPPGATALWVARTSSAVSARSPAMWRASRSAVAVARSPRASRAAPRASRIWWPTASLSSHSGYSSRSATCFALASSRSWSTMKSMSLYGATSRRAQPPVATRASGAAMPAVAATNRSASARS